jgi:eukaryotic-like serine/threonine-protein kinase
VILFSLWSLQFRGEIAELGRRWPVVLKEALERGDRHIVTNLNTSDSWMKQQQIQNPARMAEVFAPVIA